MFFLASCLTTSLESSSFSRTLQGPNYPFNYPNNALYCWRIYAPSGYVIKLTFSSLDMEVCSGCSCDSIQFFDGYSEFSSSLGKFCRGGSTITSSGRYLYVKFTSDATGIGSSFALSYYRKLKGKQLDHINIQYRDFKKNLGQSSLQPSVFTRTNRKGLRKCSRSKVVV